MIHVKEAVHAKVLPVDRKMENLLGPSSPSSTLAMETVRANILAPMEVMWGPLRNLARAVRPVNMLPLERMTLKK